jgi:putrescine transport system substrate-binding protein
VHSIHRRVRIIGLLSALLFFVTAQAEEEKILNLYTWADYIGEDTLANFEDRTGIKVNHDVYESNEMLETKLLTGSTGYDLVMPTAFFLERQIQAGVFQKLDKTLLSNYGNLDADTLARMSQHDANNAYGVPYMWGTTGIGYNEARVREVFPDAPVNSWDMLFDPEVISRLAECGVSFLDAPGEVFSIALNYLGKDPNSEDPDDLKAAEALLAEVRPYIRYFHSQQYMDDLATGEICVAMSWSGDVFWAGRRAAEAGNGVELSYSIPREGAIIWFDAIAIPSDAPHPGNAHLFLNYLMEPEVIADISNFVFFANGNAASVEFIDEQILGNPVIYPPAAVKATLFPARVHSSRFARIQTRAWTRFKTGR